MPDFLPMLTWWQWIIFAAVPPSILLLYFLKLKRKPLEVPSTYLWHKSIEDLHVNSIWQRLRNNLLLWLQLLLLLLLLIALLRPYWYGKQLSGDRFVFLIDNSASMSASDVKGTRLDEAKRLATDVIDRMPAGAVAMVVSFADTAKVEQAFTDNRRLLRRKLDEIQQTQRATNVREALKVASGLANPGRSAEDARDFQVAEALPATLYTFSDGNFEDVADFKLGHLEPVYTKIGKETAKNVGITAFTVRPKESKPSLFEAFAYLKNFGDESVIVPAELRRDGTLLDAGRYQIDANDGRGISFDIGEADEGVLKIQLDPKDDFPLDDIAYTVLNPPRPASVLLVTPGNEPLECALITESTIKIADVEAMGPAALETDAYKQRAAAATWDLIIYDRCTPKQMPQANTLFIGSLPPKIGAAEAPRVAGQDWIAEAQADAPGIIDIEAAHPLMQWLDLGDVLLLAITPLEPPVAGTVLIDTSAGAAMAIAPREQFEDAVMGFTIVEEAEGQRYIGTNWMTRQSFPVFVYNLFDYLGGTRELAEAGNLRPGQAIELEAPKPNAKLSLYLPDKKKPTTVPTDETGKANFAQTGSLGVYRVRAGDELLQKFTVNLFDNRESKIIPSETVKWGYFEVAAKESWESTRKEGWKWLVLLGIGVLLVEWFLYNRRVSL